MKSIMAYWCLGSNIDPEQHLGFAVRRFQQDYPEVLVSNLYRCPAVGFDGDDFLNLALAVKTEQSLPQLLEYADTLEQSSGRVRLERGRFDARTLDVDLIMYGDLQGIHQGRLWPSADIDEFAHVLCPMAEIAGDLRHPVSGRTFASLWADFECEEGWLKQLESPW